VYCSRQQVSPNVTQGRPYCAKDYNALFGARCAYCNGEIDGNCVNALGRMWHSDHFFCAQCGKGFDNGVFLEKNGKVRHGSGPRPCISHSMRLGRTQHVRADVDA
jgi:paxillin